MTYICFDSLASLTKGLNIRPGGKTISQDSKYYDIFTKTLQQAPIQEINHEPWRQYSDYHTRVYSTDQTRGNFRDEFSYRTRMPSSQQQHMIACHTRKYI